VLLAALLLAVLLPVAVVLGLKSPSVRQRILARVAAVVEDRTGVRLHARDFSVGLATGTLEIFDLELAAGGDAAPFLVVPRARGVVRWRTLLGDAPVIESLVVENPRLDLGAPLPDVGDRSSDTPDESSFPALVISEFWLADGTVTGPTAPDSVDVWLDSWRIEDVGIGGELDAGRFEVEGHLAWIAESHRRNPINLGVTFDAGGDLDDGSLFVETLQISSRRTTLNAQGRASMTPPEAELAFAMSAAPSELFPDLTSGGHLRASGDLVLRRDPDPTLGGVLKIDATEIPGELAHPFVGPEAGGPIDATGTLLDVALDLDVGIALAADADARSKDRVLGSSEIVWRRGAEPLLTAAVRSLEGNGVNLSFSGELTPRAPGHRRVSGKLQAPTFIDVLDGTLTAVRVDLLEPDLEEAATRLGLDPGTLPEWWPRGALEARLEADGPVNAPRMSLNAHWDHESGERLAVVSARTVDDPALRFRYRAALLPEMAGRREVSGELAASGWNAITEGEILDGRILVELPDLGSVEHELTDRFPGLLPDGWLADGVSEELFQGELSARAEISGPLLTPDVDLDADWAIADGESVDLNARGRPVSEFPFLSGAAAISVRGFGLARVDASDPSSLAGTVDATLEMNAFDETISASLRLDGHELRYGDLVSVPRLRLDVTSDGEWIELGELSGILATGTEELPVEGEFSGHGRSEFAWPPRAAEARLTFADPVNGVDRIEIAARLEEGVLHLDRLDIESPGNVATIRGAMPLNARAAETTTGPLSLSVENLDLTTVKNLFEREEGALPLRGVLNGSVVFDPVDPVSAVGSVELSGIAVGVEGEDLGLEQTLRIEMGDGRIVLPPTRLEPTGRLIRGNVPLNIAGTVDLSRDWRPGDDLVSIVEDVAFDVDGTVDAMLLNPFLAGGAARGEIAVTLTARGALETLNAKISIRGPAARVIYVRPYPTKLEDLEIDLVARQGEVVLERARARLNDGDAELTGTFDAEDGLRANLRLDGARYRLDFGIVVSLRGDLLLEWPLTGRRRIGGTLTVERAVLRRNIALGRDVLGMLFDLAPESGGTVPLDTIDLDLIVLTDEGVLIKNNVADVQADWGRMEITGTAARPLFDGRVDIRPGGIITAFGQALRIDEASFEWAGEPIMEPRMVFETTSSADDPSILKSWRNEFFTPADMGPGQGGTLDFWSSGGQGGGGGWEQVAAGAVTQATSAGRTQLTFEPLPLFGEASTQARYTLVSELSPQLSFIASTDPRETEAQTYILDIHRVPVLQTFRAQVFTNDDKNAGATLQQTLRLGARPVSESRHPHLKSTTVDITGGVSRRRVRRAIEFRKSDPFPPGATLDVEIDVVDLMRRKGYPHAEVDVDVEPVADNRVDLWVKVDTGEPVRFVFEGDPLPSRVRRSIAATYRPTELGEEASLEEVQRETVTALLGQGYLTPRAHIEALPADPADPGSTAVVRVIADGGRRIELTQVFVEGLPDDEAASIASLFGTTQSRMRLATEAPSTDAQLSRALKRRGYPAARIVDRELSEDGTSLTVRIDPGEQRHIVSVAIVGLSEADQARAAEMVEVQEGDPADADLIGLAARVIERDLRARGHAEARVDARTRPVADDRPYEVALRYEVDPGPEYRIEEVRFEGLSASRERWVRRVAGLDTGQLFRRRDVADARARLFRTNVFQRIGTSIDERPAGESADNGRPETLTTQETVVTFEVEEARRWQLAYGGRWEDGVGLSVVVDVLNRHSFGVGHLTGIRGIYGAELKSLRLYHVIPGVVGQRSSLELFIEERYEKFSSAVDINTTEAWAQLTFPLTARTHNRPYIRFQNPRITFNEPDPEEQPDQVVSPAIGWQIAWDATSRRIGEDRRRGAFLGADVLGSHEALGSDVTQFGVVGQAKYFLPFGKRETGRFTWAQFWRGGLSEARDQPVAFTDRFRLGGEFSVRGYPTNSLGPRDENGVALGGEVLFIVNQEVHALVLRTQRYGNVSVLGFFDAGNTWADRESIEGGLFKSVGVGARYLSPFGPLRLDVGFPLDRRPDDPSYKVYLGFGSVF
jgi:outer membrane protein assembly factor BamA